MPILDREGLLRLLDECDDPVAEQCALAIRSGAQADIWETWERPASHLASVYRFRLERTPRNLDVQGGENLVQRLDAAQDEQIGYATVVHGIGQTEFRVFLKSDGSSIVGCLSVVAK